MLNLSTAQRTLIRTHVRWTCESCALILMAMGYWPFTPAAMGQTADQAPPMLVVVTWNVEWMFDHELGDNRSDLAKQQSAPSFEYWKSKVANVAQVIAATKASIVALQEIEGDQTLIAIAAELREKHQLNYRFAFIQGSDRATEQDVGVLFQSGLTQYRRHEQSRAMFDSNQFYNLSKHLVAEFRWNPVDSPLTLMTVHYRATAEAEDLRIRQARLTKTFLGPQLKLNQDVILVGDMNSEHAVDDNSGDLRQLTAAGNEGGAADTGPELVDLLRFAPADQRRTHLILDRAYDRIMVSRSMVEDGPGMDWVFKQVSVRGDLVVRGQNDGPQHWDNRLTMPASELDVSDHYPVVAEFELK